MTQQRKSGAGSRTAPRERPVGPDGAAGIPQRRPLSARSVIASTLLGMRPPRLDTLTLVRSGELFGIAEGTTRVAISRMVAAGELEADAGGYRLSGPLVRRQTRQERSRAGAPRRRWQGGWRTAVVVAGRRAAEDRGALRRAMAHLRMAELRDGVWLRPDNLGPSSPQAGGDGKDGEPLDAPARQCLWFDARLADPEMSDHRLVGELWDLEAWATHGDRLRREMSGLLGELHRGHTAALAPAFEVSAAVLRHFQADPLLPRELLPAGWPGPALRAEYDEYDAAFRAVWRTWFRQHRPQR